MHLAALVVSTFATGFDGVADREPLHEAARTGNIVQAQFALMRCPDAVNQPMSWGKGYYPSPVHIAAERNRVAVLKLLLDRGGKVNTPGAAGAPPLQLAVSWGARDTAELLLARGATLDVFSAVALGKYDEVRALFRAAGLFGWQKSFANICSPWFGGQTVPLISWAVTGGQLGMVDLLIRHGAEVNPYPSPVHALERPPLHRAIGTGRLDIIALLIKNGAKIETQDCNGFTALHWAVAQKDVDAVRFLLSRGASVETRLDHYAVRAGYPNGDPRTFSTPLHTAVQRESPELVALLLARGAKMTARDSQGRNPVDVAMEVEPRGTIRQIGNPPQEPEQPSADRVLCLKLLLRYGGKPGAPRP
jgi:ankyrin repeat protein